MWYRLINNWWEWIFFVTEIFLQKFWSYINICFNWYSNIFICGWVRVSYYMYLFIVRENYLSTWVFFVMQIQFIWLTPAHASLEESFFLLRCFIFRRIDFSYWSINNIDHFQWSACWCEFVFSSFRRKCIKWCGRSCIVRVSY